MRLTDDISLNLESFVRDYDKSQLHSHSSLSWTTTSPTTSHIDSIDNSINTIQPNLESNGPESLNLESTDPRSINLESNGLGSRKLIILVTVEDYGIGISKEAALTLFQPFKQAQRMAGGTGLGKLDLTRICCVLFF